MLYKLFKPLLFSLNPESAHYCALQILKTTNFLKLNNLIFKTNNLHAKKVMGMLFKNPIGLAAGFDKNADYIDALASLGFGFIEVGTVTPRPQLGQLKPRLFRLKDEQAIINRMGFNNKGVDYLVNKLQQAKFKGIIGVNIGKNYATPLENAADDYKYCLGKVYNYASYICINISSPNTPGLRSLQHNDSLRILLQSLNKAKMKLTQQFSKHVPILLKISPDLPHDQLRQVVDIAIDADINGVVATNTTIDKNSIAKHPQATEDGGLSGAPLSAVAESILDKLSSYVQGEIPIISVGGIMSAKDAKQRLSAGADLIQLYSGLVFSGPWLVKDSLQVL